METIRFGLNINVNSFQVRLLVGVLKDVGTGNITVTDGRYPSQFSLFMCGNIYP